MIKTKGTHILLYFIGIILLIFGQRSFWEELQLAQKQKELNKKKSQEALLAANKKFEVQELTFDSSERRLKNNDIYFQTVHLGTVNFKALKKPVSSSQVETNDEEYASDSF